MRVLVACEFSGVVRDAFMERGHDAWSCDLLPTESSNGPHIMGDVLDILGDGWDLMIAHPPCTHLAVSGARWFKHKQKEQLEALDFVRALMNAPINKICIENPISVISSKIRKPDQIIQPWQFGHGETKATCLWLKGLPKLTPTNIVEGREARIHNLPPSKDRGKLRSITYSGIAKAMAEQWGGNRRMSECIKCGEIMEHGKAIENTISTDIVPDFPGMTHKSRGQTVSYGGPGKLIDCLKCPNCGWSVTAWNARPDAIDKGKLKEIHAEVYAAFTSRFPLGKDPLNVVILATLSGALDMIENRINSFGSLDKE